MKKNEKLAKPLADNAYKGLEFNDPLAYIDEKGRFIYKASGFFCLEKIYGSSYGIAGEVSRPLDFDTVYKWTNLKQEGCKLMSEPNGITICGGGKVTRIDNALSFRDIKIKFDNRKDLVNLCSYIDDKKALLEIFINVASILSKQGEIDFGNEQNNYIKIGSENISSLLSFGSTFEVKNKTICVKGGNKYIFESDELIDQLLISTLLHFAREGHTPSHNILIALLSTSLTRFINKYYLEEQDREVIEAETLELISTILLGKNKRYIFNPNKTQSLQNYFFGIGRLAKRGEWIPKVQEYLKDRLYKDNKYKKYVISDIKEDGTSIFDGIEDKKSYNPAENDLIKIREEIEKLPERDREILKLYYAGKTGEEIGRKYDIKKSRVSQIIKQNIVKIKNYMIKH